jgi:hypothetical protein
MVRKDYIITNKVLINKECNVVRNDLADWINQKYVLEYTEPIGFEIKIDTTFKDATGFYVDGFNRVFDVAQMK